MDNEIKEIIKDFKNRPNKDLIKVMDYLTTEFEKTKESVIYLTKKLDYIESSYNEILKEFDVRKRN
jgi:hypothetical protein